MFPHSTEQVFEQGTWKGGEKEKFCGQKEREVRGQDGKCDLDRPIWEITLYQLMAVGWERSSCSHMGELMWVQACEENRHHAGDTFSDTVCMCMYKSIYLYSWISQSFGKSFQFCFNYHQEPVDYWYIRVILPVQDKQFHMQCKQICQAISWFTHL